MKIEIEKKFQLTPEQKNKVENLLAGMGAELRGKSFEENTLFSGGTLDHKRRVLRLRRSGGKAILTYKERLDSDPLIKRRREEETYVDNPDAMVAILDITGDYKPALVYEKYRTAWEVAETEVTIDELPFGIFLEIEGPEEAIRRAETLLNLTELIIEPLSYAELVRKHGVKNGDVIETRFKTQKQIL